MNSLLPTLFIPLVGAILLLFFKKEQTQAIRTTAIGVTVLTFLASLAPFFGFDHANPGFQMTIDWLWIPSLDAGFRIGVDGMSVLLVVLTTFMMPIAILASFSPIQDRQKMYFLMMLLLEFGMIGVFVSLDTFLFYVFWEVILIPMYFLIGIWGGKDRIYAAVKFFLYTMFGSLLMLIAIIWLGNFAGQQAGGHFTASLVKLRDIAPTIPFEIQKWMFLAFALAFLIKVPLFPFHTWLPAAHVQAPTAGSVILAAVLLKMGTYGLIRFNLELFPQASIAFASPISWLAVAGIIYGALVAMVQTDVKKLVAYSSVSHLGFIVLGIFSMTAEGLQGGIIQMVNHGLTTGMLFLCVGIIYERRHTRELAEFGGIARVMPVFTVFFAIAMFGSVGLPGLNGFVGEYLTLIGAFNSRVLNSWWFAIIAASGVIFAAVYLLKMFNNVVYGTNDNPKNHHLPDLTRNEWLQLAPIVIFVVWIGVYPNTFMKISEASTRALVGKIEMIQFGKTDFMTELMKIKGGEQKQTPTEKK